MRFTRVALLSCASVCSLFTTSSCWAGDPSPFASFPDSCATQAQKQYDEMKEIRAAFRQPGAGWDLFDLKSPAAVSTSHTFSAESRLTYPSGMLLYRGISNTSKPRISRRSQREAKKIGKAYDLELAFFPSHLETGALLFSNKRDQYKCITDTCPKGLSCTTIDVKKNGDDLLVRLSVLRKYTTKIFRWADSVKIFDGKVARLRANYDRDEAEIKQLIEGLPNSLVVIDVTVPIK